MQIICVSRGTLSGGTALAEGLAQRLGYACLSREELIEAAVKEGVDMARLEGESLRPRVTSERWIQEREHYLAFATTTLCERARNGPLVYHGLTGHLLLTGVDHVLRIRVVDDEEHRLRAIMQSLRLDRRRARNHLLQVEDDRRRWVQALYGVAWDASSNYDFIVNLQQVNVENAASALVEAARLPDFKLTPSAERALEELYLASRARLCLARDPRTAQARFKVRCDHGVVTVAYPPWQSHLAGTIPEVLRALEGVEVRSTMAASNILWIQEEFDASSETLGEILQIAGRWNASVELLRLIPPEDAAGNGAAPPSAGSGDTPAIPNGLRETLGKLNRVGLAGGGRTLVGENRRIVEFFSARSGDSLVVVGDVYLSGPHAARLRKTRELQALISDTIRAPVVSAEDLRRRFLFGFRDVAHLLPAGVLTLLLYLVLFHRQAGVLHFVTGARGPFDRSWLNHSLAALVLTAFVPIIAGLYGSFTGRLMKLFGID
ncbi:MAG: cytidylate kinase-like family protein [Candidatus Sumerlaeota bacterium]|nr:cytidylate kinase-like family protein [Candidatus Sumerlaeota bacterium]